MFNCDEGASLCPAGNTFGLQSGSERWGTARSMTPPRAGVAKSGAARLFSVCRAARSSGAAGQPAQPAPVALPTSPPTCASAARSRARAREAGVRASVSERAGRAMSVHQTGSVGWCAVGRGSLRLPNICTLHTAKHTPERGPCHTLSLSLETF